MRRSPDAPHRMAAVSKPSCFDILATWKTGRGQAAPKSTGFTGTNSLLITFFQVLPVLG